MTGGDATGSPATELRRTSSGIQNAPCSEGGECIGWIETATGCDTRAWTSAQRTEQMEIRAASAHGRRDHRDSPGRGRTGELLGTCSVPNTGGWQSWSSFNARIKPVSGVKTLCLVFKARAAERRMRREPQLWFAQVDASNTTIWAQFKGVNPNEQLVEINVRRDRFLSGQARPELHHRARIHHAPRRHALGAADRRADRFDRHALEQGLDHREQHHQPLDLLGNRAGQVRRPVGQHVGQHRRRLCQDHRTRPENGWNRETIGHHIVRNNTISHCEQAGIVGSLGAAFSTVTGNTIHDIHVRRLFTGAEMAGIKFHAAIDTVIRNNHIYRTCLGLWLDWMAQGTRVSAEPVPRQRPRICLSRWTTGRSWWTTTCSSPRASLLDVSEGGAYAHNLFTGKIISAPEPSRETPYHPAHTTAVAGLTKIKGGDCRFYNNIFVGHNGLAEYDAAVHPVQMSGNVFLSGAAPSKHEQNPLVLADKDPAIQVTDEGDEVTLQLTADKAWSDHNGPLVTTEMLGRAKIPNLPYMNPDDTPLAIDKDYFGDSRESGQARHGTVGQAQSREADCDSLA